MESQEELTRLTTGSFALTPGRLGGVSAVATASGFTQTYATASKTVLDPSTGLGGTDYAADFSTLVSNLKLLAQNINAIVDTLQAHNLAS